VVEVKALTSTPAYYNKELMTTVKKFYKAGRWNEEEKTLGSKKVKIFSFKMQTLSSRLFFA
jgi:hypothetical protein